MNLLFRLEQKLGRYAVPNLLRYMVGAQAVFYLLEYAAQAGPRSSIVPYITLEWHWLAAGQWWRLFTFYMQPPQWHPLFVIFYVFIVFMVSDAMEQAWGSFRINLFALLGLLSHLGLAWLFGYAHPSYLVLAFLLAFAINHGDMEILLMFFIPVKWRWIGWFLAFQLVLPVFTGPAPERAMALASLAVLYVFIGPWFHQVVATKRAAVKGRKEWEEKKLPEQKRPSRACAQCGRDDKDAFARLCTCGRCGPDGKFWCEEHLGAHLKE
jgi:hypothetical protein